MKKVFFYLLLLPMMAFTMSSCIKDVAWVTPSSVHFGSEPSSQTVWFYGSYNYYTAEVDADGQGWCTVDDLGDGLVDIVTTENTGSAEVTTVVTETVVTKTEPVVEEVETEEITIEAPAQEETEKESLPSEEK